MILVHFVPSLRNICIQFNFNLTLILDPFSKLCRSERSFNDSFPLRSIPQEHVHHFQFFLYLTLILDPFSKSCRSEWMEFQWFFWTSFHPSGTFASFPIQPLFYSNIGPIFQIMSQRAEFQWFFSYWFHPSGTFASFQFNLYLTLILDPFSKSCRSQRSFNDSFPLRSIPQEHLDHFQFFLYLTLMLDPFSNSCRSEGEFQWFFCTSFHPSGTFASFPIFSSNIGSIFQIMSQRTEFQCFFSSWFHPSGTFASFQFNLYLTLILDPFSKSYRSQFQWFFSTSFHPSWKFASFPSLPFFHYLTHFPNHVAVSGVSMIHFHFVPSLRNICIISNSSFIWL